MSNHVTIDDARRIAKEIDSDGVIVLELTPDRRIVAASYGANKKKCAAIGKVLDEIILSLQLGDIVIPEEFYE